MFVLFQWNKHTSEEVSKSKGVCVKQGDVSRSKRVSVKQGDVSRSKGVRIKQGDVSKSKGVRVKQAEESLGIVTFIVRLQNRPWRLQNRSRRLQNRPPEAPKSTLEAPKSTPGGSKMWLYNSEDGISMSIASSSKSYTMHNYGTTFHLYSSRRRIMIDVTWRDIAVVVT